VKPMFLGSTLPGSGNVGQDRWRSIGRAAVVLDGASSFTPAVSSADEYVDCLLDEIAYRLDGEPGDLRAVLAESIRQCVDRLVVPPNSGPSCTVLIARETDGRFEVLSLGDSTAMVRTVDGRSIRIVDDRLSRIAIDLRDLYRNRLSKGCGYDDSHGEILRRLQERERLLRNVHGGYWIAESDPNAAAESIVCNFPLESIEWCILSTDGAQKVLDYLDVSWDSVAHMSVDEIASLLSRLHRWEEVEDRSAELMPRAKRHDDKTLVVWRP
jgi:hypothetical protein